MAENKQLYRYLIVPKNNLPYLMQNLTGAEKRLFEDNEIRIISLAGWPSMLRWNGGWIPLEVDLKIGKSMF